MPVGNGPNRMRCGDSQNIYEFIVERHQRVSTAVTSNREPAKWRAVMAGPLLLQIAIGRLQNAAYEPIIEGEAYRRRQKLGRELGDALRRAEHRAAEPGGRPPRWTAVAETQTVPCS